MPVKIPNDFVEIKRFQQNLLNLVGVFYATSNQVMKPLDKASFQFIASLFPAMRTCTRNAKNGVIQNRPLPYYLKCVTNHSTCDPALRKY